MDQTIGVLGFDSRRGLGISTSPPPPEWLWDPGTLSLGIYRPGREDDHTLPSSASSAEVKE